MSAAAIAWIAVSFLIGSFAQAVSGFGFALAAMPLLTLVLAPSDAVVAQTIIGAGLSTVMAYQMRADIDRAIVRWVAPAAALGMPVGLAIAEVVSDRVLRMAVGLAVLAATVTIARNVRAHGASRRVEVVAGFTSGVLATTTGTNGPPLVIGLSARALPPPAFRATLQALFIGANVVALPLFAAAGRITANAVGAAAIAIVPTALGRVVGERVFRRLRVELFRRVVLAMLTLAGLVAIANAVRT